MENHLQRDARHRELVAAYYQNHDERLLGTLLTELRPIAVAYARGTLRLRDGERADDAAQDALLEVLELLRARRFDLTRSIAALLCQRCRSRYLNSLDRRGARTTRPGGEDDPYRLLAVSADPGEGQAGANHDAATLLSATTGAVLALDAPARAAVVLHYYQGLPVPEAAARLGIEPTTFTHRLQRGLAALRGWAEQYPAPPAEVYACLSSVDTGDLFQEPLRMAS